MDDQLNDFFSRLRMEEEAIDRKIKRMKEKMQLIDDNFEDFQNRLLVIKEKIRHMENTDGQYWVSFSVRGVLFEIPKKFLHLSTFLTTLVSGKFNVAIDKRNNGFVVDYDPNAFRMLSKFLHRPDCCTLPYREIVEYFGLAIDDMIIKDGTLKGTMHILTSGHTCRCSNNPDVTDDSSSGSGSDDKKDPDVQHCIKCWTCCDKLLPKCDHNFVESYNQNECHDKCLVFSGKNICTKCNVCKGCAAYNRCGV